MFVNSLFSDIIWNTTTLLLVCKEKAYFFIYSFRTSGKVNYRTYFATSNVIKEEMRVSFVRTFTMSEGTRSCPNWSPACRSRVASKTLKWREVYRKEVLVTAVLHNELIGMLIASNKSLYFLITNHVISPSRGGCTEWCCRLGYCFISMCDYMLNSMYQFAAKTQT